MVLIHDLLIKYGFLWVAWRNVQLLHLSCVPKRSFRIKEGDRKKGKVVGLGWGRVTDVGGKVRGIDEETIVRTFHLKIA